MRAAASGHATPLPGLSDADPDPDPDPEVRGSAASSLTSSSRLSIRALSCTACGVCIRFCPERRARGFREAWRVVIDLAGCDGCARATECAARCPEHALSEEAGLPTRAEVALAPCSRCGRANVPEVLLARLEERLGKKRGEDARLRLCVRCRIEEEDRP